MQFYEVKRSKINIFGEHYVVLSSLKTPWYDENVEKTLTKLKLNTYDGMSILHHCTASYQRRYQVFKGR